MLVQDGWRMATYSDSRQGMCASAPCSKEDVGGKVYGVKTKKGEALGDSRGVGSFREMLDQGYAGLKVYTSLQI